jgi:hypothetical protein
MRYGTIGTLIHATLRNEDLLTAFADELEDLIQGNGKTGMENEAVVKLVWDAREIDPDHEDASEIVGELMDALNEYAPPYCYFGNTEGDGSDFGFWPSLEQIQELPTIGDPADADAMHEDCVFINDHGNVTVYDANGKVILELV